MGVCAAPAMAETRQAAVEPRVTTVSVRTFPAATRQRDDITKESTSVTVSDSTDWGGIETLDVPRTESPAEREAREQQEQREREAALRQASSRSAIRATVDTDASAVDTGSSPVLQTANQYLGVPYVYGGASPETGFDCSGLTQYVYAQYGINLPHQSEAQRAWAQANGTQVTAEDAQPGDLMWHYGHVGIYAGNGMILHAPTPGDVVRIQSASYSSFEYYRIL